MIHGEIAARQIYPRRYELSGQNSSLAVVVRGRRADRGAGFLLTVALYFSEVLIDENLVFNLEPMPFTTAMMAIEIPAAINPYSIAVAPVSSAQNFRTNAIMGRNMPPISESPVNLDRESRRSFRAPVNNL
jgi:hypothetical protein